mmetsp:Transcript_104169/g.204321  ORF Transcript_104169/g.204321 Transcript_104169/m.204321 type:complete len:228 (+) Transcript_104169:88-771(+)
MNNLVDPIKIIIIGGKGVGKTAILRRLAQLQYSAILPKSEGLEVAEFSAQLNYSASINITVIDVSASLVVAHPGSTMSSLFATEVDGVVVVAESESTNSVVEVKRWLDLISRQGATHLVQHLIIHKADIWQRDEHFCPHKLNLIVQNSPFEDWSWTVGDPSFGDVDLRRGEFEHQRAPEDTLRRMVLSILLKRQGNVCKLLPVPLKIEFKKWNSYAFEEVDKYFANN